MGFAHTNGKGGYMSADERIEAIRELLKAQPKNASAKEFFKWAESINRNAVSLYSHARKALLHEALGDGA